MKYFPPSARALWCHSIVNKTIRKNEKHWIPHTVSRTRRTAIKSAHSSSSLHTAEDEKLCIIFFTVQKLLYFILSSVKLYHRARNDSLDEIFRWEVERRKKSWKIPKALLKNVFKVSDWIYSGWKVRKIFALLARGTWRDCECEIARVRQRRLNSSVNYPLINRRDLN